MLRNLNMVVHMEFPRIIHTNTQTPPPHTVIPTQTLIYSDILIHTHADTHGQTFINTQTHTFTH